jgi:hypothetical protein
VLPPPEHFVVCVHDAWPAHARELATIFDALRPRIGRTFAVAAVPLPMEEPWSAHAPAARELAAQIRDGADELLLHGLTHRRPPSRSPLSWIIGRNDEFARLAPAETASRLRRGLQLLGDAIGLPVRGVLPPAWRAGNIPAALDDVGLDFIVGMTCVRTTTRGGGRMVPLATRSWDAGPIAPLGHLLDLWGTALSCRPTAVPSIALHPADVTRNFLPRALSCIDRLLAAGRRPTTFRQLLAPAPAPPAAP